MLIVTWRCQLVWLCVFPLCGTTKPVESDVIHYDCPRKFPEPPNLSLVSKETLDCLGTSRQKRDGEEWSKVLLPFPSLREYLWTTRVPVPFFPSTSCCESFIIFNGITVFLPSLFHWCVPKNVTDGFSPCMVEVSESRVTDFQWTGWTVVNPSLYFRGHLYWCIPSQGYSST